MRRETRRGPGRGLELGYRAVADETNTFPRSRKLSPNMTRWANAEIKAYREAKLSGESNG